MEETRIIMGMPVTLNVLGPSATKEALEKVFAYFTHVDEKFSTYKTTSEIEQINRKELAPENASEEMREVFALSLKTKKETDGYFDILTPKGTYDPSGLVKGWSIWNAAKLLLADGFRDFFVDAGGDIQTYGKNPEGKKWSIGIKNPFKQSEIVKTLSLSGEGVATSGTYIRGDHIYDPKNGGDITEIVSLTVVGPNIYEADRFATAAFAMGKKGIEFIERLPGFEGYMIDKNGTATLTSGFETYVLKTA